MKFLRNTLDRLHPLFDKGGKFEKLYPVYEALDTFLYTPGQVAHGLTHVRDAIDLKRLMSIVVMALVPCVLMACWNTGYQANLAIASMAEKGIEVQFDWHDAIQKSFGLGHDPKSLLDNFFFGLAHFLPVYIVCMAVGGTCELVFSVIRRHEINEGFLVTGLLFPLTLPPTIPLWQVAIGIAFGVVIGKEIFGGTGRNFLNPALTARAFLYFNNPLQISGSKVWTAVDGFSGATPLGALAAAEPGKAMDSLTHIAVPWGTESVNWMSAFLGTIQGSMGETSALACLLGAIVLIATRIGSWRIMAGCLIGMSVLSGFFNLLASRVDNPMFAVTPWWHLVIGGFAFGTVFMATDPVSAAMTEKGKWIYGILIGAMTVLIRVVNPAFPEGIMLAILFGNVFAPLIDYFVAQSNIKRRAARYAA